MYLSLSLYIYIYTHTRFSKIHVYIHILYNMCTCYTCCMCYDIQGLRDSPKIQARYQSEQFPDHPNPLPRRPI